MKKAFILIIVLAISTQIYAKIKAKHIVGTLTYNVETPDGQLTGKLVFTKDGKKLAGEVKSDDGNTFKMSNVEIRDGDVLYFEIQPEYEVIKISLKVADNKYEGTGSTSQWDIPITGEKKD